MFGTYCEYKFEGYLIENYMNVQMDSKRRMAAIPGDETRCRAGSRDAGQLVRCRQLADVNNREVDPMPMPLNGRLDRGWMSCLLFVGKEISGECDTPKR